MTTFERPRGIFIQLLDVEKATAYLRKNFWEDAPETFKADGMAIVNGENGLATLCSEGVGWFKDENGMIPINFWMANSSGYYDIPAEDLPSLIHETNFIDLADFIRNYNDRLENNFYQWKHYAKGYEQMSQANATMVA